MDINNINVEELEKNPDVRIIQIPKNGKWKVSLSSGEWDSSWWEVTAETRDKAIIKAVNQFGELNKYIIK